MGVVNGESSQIKTSKTPNPNYSECKGNMKGIYIYIYLEIAADQQLFEHKL